MSNKVKQLILKHTGGTGHVAALRGPLAKDARREILEAILGHTVPFSAAGINRLFEELEAMAGIGPGRSTAQRRVILTNWIMAIDLQPMLEEAKQAQGNPTMNHPVLVKLYKTHGCGAVNAALARSRSGIN